MNLNVTGINIEVTPALRTHIESKLERILRHSDGVISIAVTLTVTKLDHKAEVDVHVTGKDFHVENVDQDMYAAIDVLMDKLDRMIIKHKEKNTAHRATSVGREMA